MATSQDQNPGTGLERAKPASSVVLTTSDAFSQYVEQKRATAIVLSPATDIGSLPPQWALVPSAVQINIDEAFGEVYRDNLFCKPHEVALTKVGLRKLARAAGISWTVTREDSGTVPHYWAMKCTIQFRGHDGQIKTAEASYEWDLRDDSPRLLKFKDGGQQRMGAAELNRARLNGYRRCEAGAINAAIREIGIKQKYQKDELQRPFVVFNLVFLPDASNPTQMAMVTQAALTGASMLAGGTPAPLPGPTSHATGSIVDQLPGPTSAPATDEPFEPTPAAAKEPEPAEPAFTVIDIVRRGGGGFYLKTKETGDKKLFTADEGVASAAHTARQKNTRLHMTFEHRGEDTWIEEVRAVGAGGEKL